MVAKNGLFCVDVLPHQLPGLNALALVAAKCRSHLRNLYGTLVFLLVGKYKSTKVLSHDIRVGSL
jgi:hypothetical protein